MNRTPEEYERVPADQLESFVAAAGRAVGMPDERAATLAALLTENDLRGVFSHGTRAIGDYHDRGYARQMRDGEINPDPDLEVQRETDVSIKVDGDGGLGYFPALEATERAIEKAGETGLAAMATRNHGHFGAAGIYARRAVDAGLLAFVTSGHQLELSAGEPVYSAAGGSPMAFAAPAGDTEDVVLDFGTMHDLYPTSPHRDEIADLAPGLVLRHVGMGAICQTWGGMLPGLSMDGPREYQTYSGANQGSLALFFRPDLFADPERFRAEVDEYARQVAALEPLAGFDEALLPGAPEAERLSEFGERGVPVAPDHRAELTALAGELDIDVPWA